MLSVTICGLKCKAVAHPSVQGSTEILHEGMSLGYSANGLRAAIHDANQNVTRLVKEGVIDEEQLEPEAQI